MLGRGLVRFCCIEKAHAPGNFFGVLLLLQCAIELRHKVPRGLQALPQIFEPGIARALALTLGTRGTTVLRTKSPTN